MLASLRHQLDEGLRRIGAPDHQTKRLDDVRVSTRAGADFTDMVADCQAAGFLAKDELSAAAIQRILGRE
jgi:hypothetical protein